MTASILTYKGEQDGLRYGDLRFSDGAHRHFLHDRLSGRVILYRSLQAHNANDAEEDSDPIRLDDARKAIAQVARSKSA